MSKVIARHRRLPRAGPARERLRQKGQFWTRDWVAEAMVAYVLGGGADCIFDPAVGEGAFFRAAKMISGQMDRQVALLGTEIDPAALRQALASGLTDADLAGVAIADFVLAPPHGLFSAIVANPPYIRHHRLPGEVKARLRELGERLVGQPLDGRAGLHIYFLLRALERLDVDGRLAFIMPSDTCEGAFSKALWRWISRTYRLDAVVTFAPDASPFPGVDTNPLILMIRNAQPQENFLWLRCKEADSLELRDWVLSGMGEYPVVGMGSLTICRRCLTEGLATGLSRNPSVVDRNGPVLGDFARVVRGVVTGANDFFFLTRRQAVALQIPSEFLVPAIGRTRDVVGDLLQPEDMIRLELGGRPTLLLSLDGQRPEAFPESVQEYLRIGERMRLGDRPLIAVRRPWYKMEVRPVPPFLFAYLGRRSARFIRNLAGVVPLTGFLCVYPLRDDPVFVEALWTVLRHTETVSRLPLVGKSYGAGAIKVEPRSLERLPLPEHLVAETGLSDASCGAQLMLYRVG